MTIKERAQRALLPPLIYAAHRLPPRLGVGLLVGASVGQALVDPPRLARAFRWARVNRTTTWARLSCLVKLLANRGRFLADGIGISARHRDPARSTLVLHGKSILDDAVAAGGVIAITFHVGPSNTAPCLQSLAYAVVGVSGGMRFAVPAAPSGGSRLPEPRTVRWHDPATRGAGLYELAREVRQGRVIVLPADSQDDNRTEFVVTVGGRTVEVRSGWFTLRRLTRASTLLILQHAERSRWTIQVHPPMPPVVDDVARDREACRARLAEDLRQYVAAHPEQCVSFALRPEPRKGAGVR